MSVFTLKQRDVVTTQAPGLLKPSLSFSTMDSFAPFPLIPATIAHGAGVYLVQLPGTECGRAGPLSLRPLFQLLQHQLLSQALFFPLLQWLNVDQETVRDTELAKERRVCPGELSMSITSDYLQFYSEDFEGKASNSTLRAMFIQGKTSMSVFNSETIP